MTKTFMTSLR